MKVYPGDAMYADLNGDHVVDGNDKCVTGFATRPEYVFGMNMGFNWKGFDLSMQWVGSKNVNRMYEIEYRIPYTNAGKRGLLTYFMMVVGQRRTNWVLSIRVHRKLRKAGIPSPLLFGWQMLLISA